MTLLQLRLIIIFWGILLVDCWLIVMGQYYNINSKLRNDFLKAQIHTEHTYKEKLKYSRFIFSTILNDS